MHIFFSGLLLFAKMMALSKKEKVREVASRLSQGHFRAARRIPGLTRGGREFKPLLGPSASRYSEQCSHELKVVSWSTEHPAMVY